MVYAPNEAAIISSSNTLAKFIGLQVRNMFVNSNNFHNAHAITNALPAAHMTVITVVNEAYVSVHVFGSNNSISGV